MVGCLLLGGLASFVSGEERHNLWFPGRIVDVRVCLQRDSSRGGINEDGQEGERQRGATHLRQRTQRASQSLGLNFHLDGSRLTQERV